MPCTATTGALRRKRSRSGSTPSRTAPRAHRSRWDPGSGCYGPGQCSRWLHPARILGAIAVLENPAYGESHSFTVSRGTGLHALISSSESPESDPVLHAQVDLPLKIKQPILHIHGESVLRWTDRQSWTLTRVASTCRAPCSPSREGSRSRDGYLRAAQSTTRKTRGPRDTPDDRPVDIGDQEAADPPLTRSYTAHRTLPEQTCSRLTGGQVHGSSLR